MLSEEQIRTALHAGRVLPLRVANPHGPHGLEQLAEAVCRLSRPQDSSARVERPVALPVETWQKLEELARGFTQKQTRPVTASDIAVAILNQAVSGE